MFKWLERLENAVNYRVQWCDYPGRDWRVMQRSGLFGWVTMSKGFVTEELAQAEMKRIVSL